MTRLAALAAALLLGLAILGSAPQGASAEPLVGLSSAALAACPDCATPMGGAQAINLFERIWQLQGGGPVSFVPPTDASIPATYDFAADAEAFFVRQEALATASNAATRVTVAGLVTDVAEAAGAVPAAAEVAAVGSTLTFGSVATALAPLAIGVGGAYLMHKYVIPAATGGTSNGPSRAPTNEQLRWMASDGTATLFPSIGSTAARPVIAKPGAWVVWFQGSWTYFNAGQFQNVAFDTPDGCAADLAGTLAGHVVPMTVDGWCANGRGAKMRYLTPGELSKNAGPLTRASTPPAGATTVAPGPQPSRTAVATALSNMLNSPDGALTGHNLAKWIEHNIYAPTHGGTLAGGPTSATSGTAPEDPTVAMATVPNCIGDSYAACVTKLTDAGLAGGSRVDLGFDGAVLTKPAGATVSTNPAAGARVDTATQVTVTTNPDDADYPRLVPDPAPGTMTATQYNSTLTGAGLTPDPHVLTDDAYDPAYGPDVVIGPRVSPRPGTKVHKGTTVTYTANPSSAPDPASGASGDCGLTPPSYAFDLSPLTSANLGSKVPFSLVGWVATQTAGVATAAERPNPSFTAFGVTVDMAFLANLEGPIAALRMLLALLLWLGVAWFLYGKTIGRGG